MIEQEVPNKKVDEIVSNLLDQVDRLLESPYVGQKESYLKELSKDHRRIIVNHIKVVYKVEQEMIYVTDVFDSRQDPDKMYLK